MSTMELLATTSLFSFLSMIISLLIPVFNIEFINFPLVFGCIALDSKLVMSYIAWSLKC